MTIRWLLAVALAVAVGCATTPAKRHFDCPDEVVGEWEIPGAWLEDILSPKAAHLQVVTGNLGKESIEERWNELRAKWQAGDEYWRYRRPDKPWIGDLGAQEGVVLIRGCRQIGYVATSVFMTGEGEQPIRPDSTEQSSTP